MKITDILLESASGFLYHSLPLRKFRLQADEFLSSGGWKANTHHPIKSREDAKKYKSPEDLPDHEYETSPSSAKASLTKGTCFTRSPHLGLTRGSGAGGFGNITFVVNRAKLAANNKIIPIDGINIHSAKGDKRARQSTGSINKEAEDFVIGDIKNFANAVSKIIVYIPKNNDLAEKSRKELESEMSYIGKKYPNIDIEFQGMHYSFANKKSVPADTDIKKQEQYAIREIRKATADAYEAVKDNYSYANMYRELEMNLRSTYTLYKNLPIFKQFYDLNAFVANRMERFEIMNRSQ